MACRCAGFNCAVGLENASASSQSSPRANQKALQLSGSLGTGALPAPPPPSTPLPNFAAGTPPPHNHPRVLSAGGATQRVCSICLCPASVAQGISRNAATPAATQALSVPQRSPRARGLMRLCRHACFRINRTPCSCRPRSAQGDPGAAPCKCAGHVCCSSQASPLAGGSASCPSGPPVTPRGGACLTAPAADQPAVAPASANDALRSPAREPAPVSEDTCTCKGEGHLASATQCVLPAKLSSQPAQGDPEGTLRPPPPSGTQGPDLSLVDDYGAPAANRSPSPSCASCQHPYKLQQLTPRIRPPCSTRFQAGPCFQAALVGAPEATIGHSTTAAVTAGTTREQHPGRIYPATHPLEPALQEVQQQFHKQLLQQLQNQLQKQLEEQLQQQLQSQIQQLQWNTRSLAPREASYGYIAPQLATQRHLHHTIHLGAPQLRERRQHQQKRPHSRTAVQRHVKTASGERTACPVTCSAGGRGLVRCHSGPLSATTQPSNQFLSSPPLPVPAACVQRQQWLQSWTADAQGSKEQQLHTTIKELSTRSAQHDVCGSVVNLPEASMLALLSM